jgi:hypothetical protein
MRKTGRSIPSARKSVLVETLRKTETPGLIAGRASAPIADSPYNPQAAPLCKDALHKHI